jgi:hypothetical protein
MSDTDFQKVAILLVGGAGLFTCWAVPLSPVPWVTQLFCFVNISLLALFAWLNCNTIDLATRVVQKQRELLDLYESRNKHS